MRWLLTVALLLVCSISPTLAQTPEHRGLWVGTADYDTPDEGDAVVARAAAAHLNALYVLVWYNGGQAWYKSSLSPMAKGVSEGFDPLGHLLKTAHARGIDVHAWFVNGSYGWADPGSVFDKHPDWALQTLRKTRPQWYDLGKPEVREFQTAVMLDCLRNYDLDGLHFDYIRYDSQQYCYCDHCQNEFSARSGLPPLSEGGKLFPAALSLSGNPLANPSTAQVLATFDDGVPAIALNKLGQGEAALLNWHAVRTQSPALDDTVSRLLQRFGSTKDNLYQLRTTQTAAKYPVEAQDTSAQWLAALGYKPRVIDETKLAQVSAGGTIFLYGQYYLPEETSTWLKQFVSAGGHCLFGDGPVFAMASPALQEVLGFKSSGKFFSGMRIISPAAGQDFLQMGPALNPELESTRLDKWVEYRKWTVTQLVRSVRDGARKVKPQAKISAAVFHTRDSANLVCQDWYAWLKDGLVDYVVPMAYLMENEKLQAALDEYKAADPTLERIIPGLSVYQLKDGKAGSRPRSLVLSQVELSRQMGAHGDVFFSSGNLNDDLAEALGSGPYQQPVRPYYPGASAR